MNRNFKIAAGAVRDYKCIWLVLFASLVLHTLPAYSFSVHSTVQVLSKVITDTSAKGLQLWRSNPASKATFNSQSTLRRDVMTAVWRDSVVSLTIPASKERTYDLFSSLDQHPTWSPWLQNVEFNRDTKVSKWTLKSLGLTVSWNANNTIMDHPNCVQWESLNGFPNKGRVQFSDDCDVKLVGYDDNGYEVYEEDDECSIVPESTLLTLTISYDLPKAGVFILESLGPAGKEFIQQTLLGDLKRFRERLVRDLRDERMESFRKSQIGRNYGKNAELLQ